ncbi:MAG: capsular polysaccharide secretin KpsD [Idiomarinaceae bacterium HL-53]|nr:MAG: capsular polysaccharide secretin KpsD [Idiomarinaceae bacterium HL-53]CUS47127.1 protein involved in polysaccharide export, contains SLBB domain of the beta-grasp fold [Idiomarinaceae bacterium HL-53]
MKGLNSKIIIAAATCILSSFTAANAQSFGDIPAEQRAQALQEMQGDAAQTPFQEPQARANWRENAGYGMMLPTDEALEEEIEPFGASLFGGGFRGLRADGLNPNYRILPGDQITLRVWGAVDIDRVLPVDAQGNIFIPSIGPIQVQGISHGELDNRVRAAVRTVYPENVNVYTNLQGVQSVSVFVTGYVEQPGRYAGVPSDSVLYFLDQASGIDHEQGSFRKVRLIREGETIATLDLYDFLLSGTLRHPQLENGDTLLVEPRGSVVNVHGDVGKSYAYELNEERLLGSTLTNIAQLTPGVTHALIRGVRTQGLFSEYLTLDQFEEAEIGNGDEVIFLVDQSESTIVVQLEGKFKGPTYYVLPKGTTLVELLNAVPVNPVETDYKNVSLRRISIAERQKEALEESLRRLEMTYLGAASATSEEAAIRIREAELISQFVERARETEPNGRLVVTRNDALVDIRLQDGDIITLPEKTDAVLISGEVYVPQAAVYVQGKSVRDYIASAGGFSAQADEDRILVIRANGEVRYSGDIALRPGDEILVMPKVSSKNLQLASTITQIIYQVAVATRVVTTL